MTNDNQFKDVMRDATKQLTDSIASALAEISNAREIIGLLGVQASMEVVRSRANLASVQKELKGDGQVDLEKASDEIARNINATARAIGLFVIKETYEKYRAEAEEKGARR